MVALQQQLQQLQIPEAHGFNCTTNKRFLFGGNNGSATVTVAGGTAPFTSMDSKRRWSGTTAPD